MTVNRRPGRSRLIALTLVVVGLAPGCVPGPVAATPPIVAGSSTAPRDVNLIARDYTFVPDVLDLVPGETILLHLINAGLVVHEAVIGDASVQDAWEVAEAAAADAPPGPTPVVTVPSGVAGLRVVVGSGERIDLTWTVPLDVVGPANATAATPGWLVGCHIPGHLAKGMQIPIRWILPRPNGTASEPAG